MSGVFDCRRLSRPPVANHYSGDTSTTVKQKSFQSVGSMCLSKVASIELTTRLSLVHSRHAMHCRWQSQLLQGNTQR